MHERAHDDRNEHDDEIGCWYAGEVDWTDLSPAARLSITLAEDLSTRLDGTDEASESQIIDDRHLDDLGPWARISAMLELLSGADSHWITPDELADAIPHDDHLRSWIDGIAEVTGAAPEVVARDVVSVWADLDLEGRPDIGIEATIETTFDGDTIRWRTIAHPVTITDADVTELVERICRDYDGTVVGSTAGRVQISLPQLELFVGRIIDPDIPHTERFERPMTLSALCGVELDDDAPASVVIANFFMEPSTPGDLTTKITSGIGVQVWLDRAIGEVERAQRGIDSVVDEFLPAAFRLTELLGEHDRGR